MSLNIRKMGIGFTNKTSFATTQQTTVNNIQTKEQKSSVILSGKPQSDIFVAALRPKVVQKVTIPQIQAVKTAQQELSGALTKKDRRLLEELKKRAQYGELEIPQKEDIDIIMAMPIDNSLKKDLRELLADPEKCKNPEEYNKGIQEILNKHGIA